MTTQQMRRAGRIVNGILTGDDLELAIKANALILANLEARGISWSADIVMLRNERERLRGVLKSRKRRAAKKAAKP